MGLLNRPQLSVSCVNSRLHTSSWFTTISMGVRQSQPPVLAPVTGPEKFRAGPNLKFKFLKSKGSPWSRGRVL